ncbi:MAG: hypothetical protein JSV88_03210 [Candidatus Aminicenantes bacterium]|nr:MAG: hypothetical protein JSV88_03210 [Candidatus Aminicenantes bacterium]
MNRRHIEDILPLTPMQESMLYQYLRKPEGKLYFEQNCYQLTGDVEVSRIKGAWNRVAAANEMLRIVFRWQRLKRPVQIVLKNLSIPVKEVNLSQLNDETQQQELFRIKEEDRQKIIDLTVQPFRVILCKLEKNKSEMIVTNHHILFDGWSNVILLKEFFEAYHMLSRRTPAVMPVKNRFKEYIKWQQNQDKIKQKNYWKKLLQGFKGTVSLAARQNRNSTRGNHRNEYYEYPLPGDLQKKIMDFSKHKAVTPAVIFYSAWALLLYKYCQAADVIFGITLSGRNSQIKVMQDMVGLFINTLPFRVKIDTGAAIEDFLRDVGSSLIQVEEFQSTSLTDIISYSERDPREALFDSVVVIQNYPVDKILYQGGNQLSISLTTRFYKTDIDIALGIRTFEGIILEFAYNPDIFAENVVREFLGYFTAVVRKMVLPGKAGIRIKDILDPEQKERQRIHLNLREDRNRLNEIDEVNTDEIF